jgi:hypothetical protein
MIRRSNLLQKNKIHQPQAPHHEWATSPAEKEEEGMHLVETMEALKICRRPTAVRPHGRRQIMNNQSTGRGEHGKH